MARWLATLGLVLLLTLGTRTEAAEVIRSFDAVIAVQENGDLDITETLVVNAEGDAIVHGIYRDFPRFFVTPDGGRGKVAFDVQAVSLDGAPADWDTSTIDGGTRLRIGSADVTLGPGLHEFRISYRTDRQIRFQNGFDALVWNVTGDGWAFPILSARAAVTLPAGVEPEAVAVHTGARGARDQNATGQITGDQALFATTRPLGPHEGLTIEVKLPAGSIAPPDAGQLRAWWWRDHGASVVGLTGLGLVLVYFILVWVRVGRDPRPGVIVPRWDPPAGVSPALAVYIDTDGFSGPAWRALSASALDLAVKGLVTLEDLDRAVTIRRTDRPVTTRLPVGQAALIAAVEQAGGAPPFDPVHGKAVGALGNRFTAAITAENGDRFHKPHRALFLVGVVLSLIVAGVSYLLADLDEDVAILVGLSTLVPLALSLVARWPIAAWKRTPSFLLRLLLGLVLAAIILLGCALFRGMWFVNTNAPGSATSFAVVAVPWGLVLLNRLFFSLNGAATLLGRQMKDHLEGLRRYLTLAEAERMNLKGAPLMSPSHFETLLPYAVALGVEKPWSHSFETWLATAVAGTATATAYSPGWYSGSGSNFAHRIGGFSSSLGASMSAAVPPPSSSSSFGSGSSGSGGGGGGGGGW